MTELPIRLDLPRPILVVGGYGYRNLGDEAMLAGLLRLLGRDGVTVVSRRPDETTARHAVRSVGIGGALRALTDHRSVVIGGGGLFGRDMGRLGRLLPAFGLVASAAGRDVALVGIGIDEQPTGALGVLARRATRVVVRDRRSVDRFAEADVRAELVADLSTLVPSAGPAAARRALRGAGLDPARPLVGLCLTAVNPELEARVVEAVLGLVDARPDLQACLLPMSRHPFVAPHDDERLARRLAALRPRLQVLEIDDPATALAVFGTLDAAVCMRFHSLLFADRMARPIVAIPYAAKCDAWLAEHDLVPTEPTAEALIQAIGGLVPAVRRAGVAAGRGRAAAA